MTEQPEFMQGIPKGGSWALVGEYDKRRGQIDYREVQSGRTIRVPNIWYNQPLVVRIEAMEFYAAREDDTANSLKDAKSITDINRHDNAKAGAVTYRQVAMEMRITGMVLA